MNVNYMELNVVYYKLSMDTTQVNTTTKFIAALFVIRVTTGEQAIIVTLRVIAKTSDDKKQHTSSAEQILFLFAIGM